MPKHSSLTVISVRGRVFIFIPSCNTSTGRIDCDDFEFTGDLQSALSNRFSKYRFICYSTASSLESFPKFRLVFPLTKNIQHEKIRHFWYALQTELGDLGDKQTKDLSRMYYVPAKYDNAFNFIFSRSGDFINPDTLLNKYPYKEKSNNSFFDRLPEDMQKEIIEHRKSQLDNTNINWSSYKNCPFFPRQLEKEYRMISSTGWYHKMYQIMVATAGNAIMTHRFREYGPHKGEIAERMKGSLISMEAGTSTAFSIGKLQDRGRFFVSPGADIYKGQVIGENTRQDDMTVNITKTKKMSNVRSSGADDKAKIVPAIKFSLEEALEYIQKDEYVEVTPNFLRVRKVYLKEVDRKRYKL